MDNADVGMLQPGNSLGFRLEARVQLWVGRQMSRQDLDGYRTLQPGVARAIHLSHAARAKERLNLIWSELRTWDKCHRQAIIPAASVGLRNTGSKKSAQRLAS